MSAILRLTFNFYPLWLLRKFFTFIFFLRLTVKICQLFRLTAKFFWPFSWLTVNPLESLEEYNLFNISLLSRNSLPIVHLRVLLLFIILWRNKLNTCWKWIKPDKCPPRISGHSEDLNIYFYCSLETAQSQRLVNKREIIVCLKQLQGYSSSKPIFILFHSFVFLFFFDSHITCTLVLPRGLKFVPRRCLHLNSPCRSTEGWWAYVVV